MGLSFFLPICRKRCRALMFWEEEEEEEEENEEEGVHLKASRKTVPCSLCRVSAWLRMAERLMGMPSSC